jgi:DNA-binding transcriptional ArsR family regulator
MPATWSYMVKLASRADAASELTRLLRTPFLRALAEPARLDVLEVMLAHGGGDVASIAAHLPQDRSVVSRHLQSLEDAGVVRSTWQGRHRRYELDGGGFVKGFEALATKVRALANVCCPPDSEPPPAARRRK